MLSPNNHHIPVRTWVLVALVVAILACAATVFAGAGTTLILTFLNVTPTTAEDDATQAESTPTVQRTIAALETQLAAQATSLAQPQDRDDEVVAGSPDTTIAEIMPGCGFVTTDQIEELKLIQGVSDAIRKAEEYSGYQQNDYAHGDTIPREVLIATDLLTTDIAQFGVIPINRQGGWGLFLTTDEFQAPNAGTYWCIQE